MSDGPPITPKVTLKIPSKILSKSSAKNASRAPGSSSKSKSKSKPGGGGGGLGQKEKARPKPKSGGIKAAPGKGKPKPKPKPKPKGGGGQQQATPAPTGSKKKDEGLIDLEQHFILRMPPGPAMALRHDVESGAMNLKDKFSIELSNESPKGFVRYGGQVLNARLVDLPGVIETLKTTDRKTFYKTAGICQMLLCKDSDFDSDEETPTKKPKEKDKKYKWIHGITPPLKNVRKRRFRKTLIKKQHQDMPDIEKEVKRLFRMDNEAIDVKWEVVVEEDEGNANGDNPDSKSHHHQVLAHGDVFNPLNSSEAKKVEEAAARGNISTFLASTEKDIFGELSSSEEELEEEDPGEINIMDSGEDEPTQMKSETNDDNDSISVMSSVKNENEDSGMSFNQVASTPASASTSVGPVEDKPEVKEEEMPPSEMPQFTVKSEMFDSFMSTDPTMQTMSEEEIREQMSELSQHMQDLRDRRLTQEMELSMMENSSLRDRLERELNNMIEEENEKQKEYDNLAAMLGIPT